MRFRRMKEVVQTLCNMLPFGQFSYNFLLLSAAKLTHCKSYISHSISTSKYIITNNGFHLGEMYYHYLLHFLLTFLSQLPTCQKVYISMHQPLGHQHTKMQVVTILFSGQNYFCAMCYQHITLYHHWFILRSRELTCCFSSSTRKLNTYAMSISTLRATTMYA